eukprot:scaffold4072_cov61-Phaeocystis_antarctica.AAC.3
MRAQRHRGPNSATVATGERGGAHLCQVSSSYGKLRNNRSPYHVLRIDPITKDESRSPLRSRHIRTRHTLRSLHADCQTAAPLRSPQELDFPPRSIGQRRSLLEARGRLLELRCRARPRLPSAAVSGQHHCPHSVGCLIVRRRAHNPRRQRLKSLVVPPLRLGHLVALLQSQRLEGHCCDHCPLLRSC